MRFMQNCGYTMIDTSNLPDYQEKDIDFIAEKNGIAKTIEVKTDNRIRKTNNLYIENMTDIDKQLYGWYHYCQADYLAYIDNVAAIVYLIPFDKVKAAVEQGKARLIKVQSQRQDKQKSTKYQTGWLLNIAIVKDSLICRKLQ
ncbi:MAG: hypothetical protein PHE63_00310 [Eubacteriales bacterium]|nr:hypothetical protein [Eubacteriales bacterium]